MKRRLTLCITLAAIAFADSSGYAQKGRGQGAPGGPRPQIGRGPQISTPRKSGPSTVETERDRKQNQNRPAVRDRQSQDTLSDRFESNPKLAERVRALLPAGTTLETASVGFKNQGQFIAALHVSKNLNIPFADLKSKLTGDDASSLGNAIHDLRPDLGEARAREEAMRAEQAARKTQT